MQVFKFGGASVKDADSIKNLFNIIFNRLQNPSIIVVSAMGKSTNALESILELKLGQKSFSSNYTIFKNYHLSICSELFPENDLIFDTLEKQFNDLQDLLNQNLNPEDYDEYYDQIICYGEIIATIIIQAYLSLMTIKCVWQDAREIIATNSDYRFAKIDWVKTRKSCQEKWKPLLDNFPILTQGFIGSDSTGKTTTLGREGSDFTAAILATGLDAGSVTIWKDVLGVLNADPKRLRRALRIWSSASAARASMSSRLDNQRRASNNSYPT